MAVNPIPEGYPRLMAYLSIDGATDAIAFYTEVFGFKEKMRMPGPDGVIGHAELELAGSVLMLADSAAAEDFPTPKKLGGTPVNMTLYTEDVDATHKAALAKGANELRAPEDQFYGDRSATVEDPWGHRWTVMTHVEDVSPEEMEKRMAAMGQG
ncbi:MAG: PhnB protein [Actinomycetota bacterium]|jgi:PhnB protein